MIGQFVILQAAVPASASDAVLTEESASSNFLKSISMPGESNPIPRVSGTNLSLSGSILSAILAKSTQARIPPKNTDPKPSSVLTGAGMKSISGPSSIPESSSCYSTGASVVGSSGVGVATVQPGTASGFGVATIQPETSGVGVATVQPGTSGVDVAAIQPGSSGVGVAAVQPVSSSVTSSCNASTPEATAAPKGTLVKVCSGHVNKITRFSSPPASIF